VHEHEGLQRPANILTTTATTTTTTSFEMGLSCPLSCGKAVWQPGSTYKVDLSQSDHPRTQTADPHRLKMSRLTGIWPSSAYITRIRGSTCIEVAVRAVGCGQRISGMQEIASLEGIVCLESIGVGCSRAPRPPRGIDIVDRISHIQQDGAIYRQYTRDTDSSTCIQARRYARAYGSANARPWCLW
jgi:hypothetical protein